MWILNSFNVLSATDHTTKITGRVQVDQLSDNFQFYILENVGYCMPIKKKNNAKGKATETQRHRGLNQILILKTKKMDNP